MCAYYPPQGVTPIHGKKLHKSPVLPDDDTHRVNIPLDHPDQSVIDAKLADLLLLRLAPDGRIKPMSDIATTLWFVLKNIAEDKLVEHAFAPDEDERGYLGLETKRWGEIHTQIGYFHYWFDPYEDDIARFGSPTKRIRTFHSVDFSIYRYLDFRTSADYIASILRFRDNDFAGQVTTGADGYADIAFPRHVGTIKPTVILATDLLVETKAVFPQIDSWFKDADGNYTGCRVYALNHLGKKTANVSIHYFIIQKY